MNQGPERRPPPGRPQKKRQYGITLDQAQDHLDEWLEAEYALTTHQSYRLRDQTLTLADLDSVRRNIEYWNGKVNELLASEQSGSRNRIYRAVPKDD